jgi:hypothetical protein
MTFEWTESWMLIIRLQNTRFQCNLQLETFFSSSYLRGAKRKIYWWHFQRMSMSQWLWLRSSYTAPCEYPLTCTLKPLPAGSGIVLCQQHLQPFLGASVPSPVAPNLAGFTTARGPCVKKTSSWYLRPCTRPGKRLRNYGKNSHAINGKINYFYGNLQ